MSILDWMDVIYLANSSLFTGYVVIKLLYMLIVRRGLTLLSRRMLIIVQFVILSDVLIGVTEVGVHYLLMNIDEYRHSVVAVRGTMSVCLVLSITSQVAAILEFVTRGHWTRILFWR
jgi:hypothetical protein